MLEFTLEKIFSRVHLDKLIKFLSVSSRLLCKSLKKCFVITCSTGETGQGKSGPWIEWNLQRTDQPIPSPCWVNWGLPPLRTGWKIRFIHGDIQPTPRAQLGRLTLHPRKFNFFYIYKNTFQIFFWVTEVFLTEKRKKGKEGRGKRKGKGKGRERVLIGCIVWAGAGMNLPTSLSVALLLCFFSSLGSPNLFTLCSPTCRVF